uniref:Protein kinase domain-containing protein n=1 Tax=Rhizochromulina marina TaxID=1034831 RepID=A0A7S2WT96_9STRA|mmetsp:Transcript_32850/g.95012  ORF Transcript_32850/g.95012 Transcript_32850/m.95012 type:complete len:587 (+) Transcript_32850:207-1967(+)
MEGGGAEPPRAPTLLDVLSDQHRVAIVNQMTRILAQHGGVTPEALAAIQQEWLNSLQIQISDGDVQQVVARLLEDPTVAAGLAAAMGGAGPGQEAAVPPPPPEMDDEEIVAAVLDLLHRAATVVEDQQVNVMLRRILAAQHNRPLARRVHRELNAMATSAADAETRAAAQRAAAVIELIYHVIVSQADPALLLQQAGMDPGSRRVMCAAFDRVGMYARSDPFQGFRSAPAEVFQATVVNPVTGDVIPNPEGEPVFSAVHSTGTGRTYGFIRKLKKCIYGSVRLAAVLEPLPDSPEQHLMASRRFTMSEERVAVKCIEKQRVDYMMQQGRRMNENPLKEIGTMQYLTDRMQGLVPADIRGDPARVLPMIECIEDDQFLYMIMPCLPEELFHRVEDRSEAGLGAFPESEVFQYFSQLLDGLEALHSVGLVHHDMSLENVMLDHTGRCVIIDMGMAVKVPMPEVAPPVKLAPDAGWPGRCGKNLYLAPEILEPNRSFDPFKLDIWAMGIMMFILITGVPPWDVKTGPFPTDRRFQLVITGQLDQLLRAWNIVISPSAQDLVQRLLLENPAQRPTIEEIRAHPWFVSRGL